MIEVVIFDLDDTLIDTTHLVLPMALKKAYQVLIQSGAQATPEELEGERIFLRSKLSHYEIFPLLAERYFAKTNISKNIVSLAVQKAVQCFYEPEIYAPFPLIEGAQENLDRLYRKKEMYLVTSGNSLAQQKKVKACQIEKYFKHCFYVESTNGQDKSFAFKEILKRHAYKPSVFLSVGNRLSSEIREAKKLGMQTCFFQFGEHQDEVPASPEEQPDFIIHQHKELIETCQILSN